MEPTAQFEAVLIIGKGLFLALFTALALANGYQDYISKDPRKFLLDCFVSGGLGAMAFIIIALMRGRGDLAVSIGLSSFLLFFIINVLFEMSGFNELSTPGASLTSSEQKEKNIFKNPAVFVPVLAVLAVYLYLFFRAMIKVKQPFPPTMFKETAVFAVLSGVMGAYVAWHHQAPAGINAAMTIGMTIMWAILYVFLQRGGFIDHTLFRDVPPCIK